MKAYSISYDLLQPGKDYTKLTDALKGLGAVKILYSEWVLKSTSSAEQLRNHLQQFIDENDRLLVAGLTGQAAWTGLLTTNDGFKQALAS